MFDGLKRLWGRIVSMFNYTTLKNIIGKDVALSQTMIDAINDWKRMLVGNADWCDDDTVESLKLEEGICREFDLQTIRRSSGVKYWKDLQTIRNINNSGKMILYR